MLVNIIVRPHVREPIKVILVRLIEQNPVYVQWLPANILWL